MSPQNRLRTALANVDEATLAEHLRVSVPALRRFVSGELRMNWVISTRLATLTVRPEPEPVDPPAAMPEPERHRAKRRERRITRPHGTQVAAAR